MSADRPGEPNRGDEYVHSDGTREVVFAVAEGRVLTVREYRAAAEFEASVENASYRGVNTDVADLSLSDFQPDEE